MFSFFFSSNQTHLIKNQRKNLQGSGCAGYVVQRSCKACHAVVVARWWGWKRDRANQSIRDERYFEIFIWVLWSSIGFNHGWICWVKILDFAGLSY